MDAHSISDHLYALSPTTRLAPDAAVILGERGAELRGAKLVPIVPDMVCDVLPPEVSLVTLHRRLRQYFDAGVKEVWLIDPETNSAEIWTGPKLPRTEFGVGESLTSALLPGFAVPLDELLS